VLAILGLSLIALAMRQQQANAGKSQRPYTGKSWYPHLLLIAQQRSIPATVALSLVRQESNGVEIARGSSGEIGLFQLKKEVALDYARITGNAADISNPNDNIRVGLWYLSWLRDHWKLSLHDALQAYNSGIGNFLNGKIQFPNYASQILDRAEGWS